MEGTGEGTVATGAGRGEGLARQFDGYCERTDLTLWSEPVNAVTNAAFLIAALWAWRRVRAARAAGQPLPVAELLCLWLAAIGVGSALFHTFATVWAVIADIVPIVGFTLTYVFVSHRYFWRQGRVAALMWTGAFLPYAAVTGPAFAALPFFSISSAYWPIVLLIAIHAAALWRREPATARGLAIGAGIVTLSLVFRSVDETVCAAFPLGTHFLWHILNGVALGWLIEVYRRHATGEAPGQARGA